jgi:hypothetical protein
MKRRKFAQSVLATLSLSCIPAGLSLAAQSSLKALRINESIITVDGLKLALNQQVHPTNNQDEKQFILTYDVENNHAELEEKIHEFKLANGEVHQMYMTPINNNQLQAVFNWRLNA